MGQMGKSLRDAILCGGISEEESAVRVSERILKRQAEPAMDKAKSRYAKIETAGFIVRKFILTSIIQKVIIIITT